jgi:glycerophosphoryl diester phosphodiesterase
MDVYAHRGACVAWPENTLEAFGEAIAAGADAIETDLRLARDGTIVLVHDEDFLRVAGDPRRVADLTSQEIGTLRVGRRCAVPQVEELLELASGRVRLNLEIKAPGVGAALARRLGARCDGVLVTCSDPSELRALRAQRPGVPVGAVLENLGARERALARSEGWAAVSLSVQGFEEAALSFCRTQRLDLLLWVVNAPERVIDFARLGIHGVFSDCPSTAVAALRRLSSRRGDLVP